MVWGQWTDQNSTISAMINDVYFINESEGWAVANNGKIVHTTDGGSNWSTQNSGTSENLNGVMMVSSSMGYAVGDNGTCVKYDGSSWSTISLGNSRNAHDVYFVNDTTGWIAQSSGYLNKTTDGGSSWTNEGDNISDYFDVFMLSASEGWACGSGGDVYQYNGSSWSSTDVAGNTEDLLGIHFSSSSNGFVVGENSKVYYYGGSGWTQHSTPLSGSQFIYDVHVLGGSEAWAVVDPGTGGSGKILKYNGSSWDTNYVYNGGGTELFYGVHFPSSSKGYAVGSGGMVKTYGTSSVVFSEKATTLSAKAHPNPFSHKMTLSYTVPQPSKVRITLYNVMGEKVARMTNRPHTPGQFSTTLKGGDLSSGFYFIQLQTGDRTETVKVVKRRYPPPPSEVFQVTPKSSSPSRR
jgi:photosystem II stability/assembly factor-like uncharacterized protein